VIQFESCEPLAAILLHLVGSFKSFPVFRERPAVQASPTRLSANEVNCRKPDQK